MSSASDHIERLIFMYAERIDAGDFEGVSRLFAQATITSEGSDHETTGREQVLAMYERTTRRYPNGTPLTRHLTTNVIIDVDEASGDATARSYFTVLQAVPDELALQPIIAGRYHDAFAHTDGSWHFTRRHMIIDLVGDLGQHLLFNLR